MEFPIKLKRHLKQNGLTQGELAAIVGTAQSNVSDWARGKSLPSVLTARKMARALGVSMDYLFDDSLDQEPHIALTPEETVLLDVCRRLGPNGVQELLSRLIIGQGHPGWLPVNPSPQRVEDSGQGSSGS